MGVGEVGRGLLSMELGRPRRWCLLLLLLLESSLLWQVMPAVYVIFTTLSPTPELPDFL